MKKHTLLLIFFISFTCFSQKNIPSNYFAPPLKNPIILAGTFGELRNNHYHAGIDIKTYGREGLKVYAAADGYVSRIKVALWGYGKVIYITHPNGFTSVYAHLQKFENSIEEFVKKIQYKKKSYETGNIFLKKDQIKIKKGQVIAYSGSTGGFIAPHLHFEIRDTQTEHTINPMLFGFVPPDTIAPKIKDLMAYPINNDSRIEKSNKKNIIPFQNIGKDSFSTNLISANGKIGFGIEVYDLLNKAKNNNGIYSLEMYVNGKLNYQHRLDSFSFNESKYINLFIDYPHYANYKKKFQKTHKAFDNKLSIYKKLITNGIINIKEGNSYIVEIIAKDFKGNKSHLRIPVIGVKNNSLFTEKDTTAYKINAKEFNKFKVKNVTMAFPKNTFYENCFLDIKMDKKNEIIQVHTPTIPLDKNYTLTFDVSKYSEEEKQYLYIANLNNNKYPSYQNTVKKEQKFYTTTKVLGKYKLLKDTKKPVIQLKNFKDGQSMTHSKTLIVKINDLESGIQSYKASIDNQWVLMEYNLKKQTLTYDFKDKKFEGIKHSFKIEVMDNVGNTTKLNATFLKKL